MEKQKQQQKSVEFVRVLWIDGQALIQAQIKPIKEGVKTL